MTDHTTPPAAPPPAGRTNAEKNLTALISVMATLRDPEKGCAWDLNQTHESISPYTIEEAYEVAEAIQEGNPETIRDELGDLLLQVVFQARIGEEAGHFDFASIADSITEKMIRRHPHIFGDDRYRDSDEQRKAWEDIKEAERHAKKEKGTLDGVASTLPPVTRAVKLQKRAARVGFDWTDPADVLAKIREEIDEVEMEMKADTKDRKSLEAELGDLLFAVINLARKCQIDPDHAINLTNRKFINRFTVMERLAKSQGKSFPDSTLAEMEEWWTQAKREESQG
ncbi:nucleoside triphosphate pyrophosphohydrolase [Alphaproteobacteria bacterium LSUCC0684]